MSKLQVKWSPEGASAREWTIDLRNPAWDLMYQTEIATGWPWAEFVDKLTNSSAVALRALLYTLRRRDETKLALESVTVELDEIEFEDVAEPPAKKAKKASSDGRPEESGEA